MFISVSESSFLHLDSGGSSCSNICIPYAVSVTQPAPSYCLFLTWDRSPVPLTHPSQYRDHNSSTSSPSLCPPESCPAMTSMNPNNIQHGIVTLSCSDMHTVVTTKNSLIGLKPFSTKGKSGLVLEIYPGLMNSQILEGNLQLPRY